MDEEVMILFARLCSNSTAKLDVQKCYVVVSVLNSTRCSSNKISEVLHFPFVSNVF